MVVMQGEALLEVLGHLSLRVKLGLPGDAGLLPGALAPAASDVGFVPALLVRNPRCRPRSVMPSTTEDTQPPEPRRPIIPRTWSSVAPITEARLFTLAKGIRAVILSNRRCSSFSGCRGAIVIPPFLKPFPLCRSQRIRPSSNPTVSWGTSAGSTPISGTIRESAIPWPETGAGGRRLAFLPRRWCSHGRFVMREMTASKRRFGGAYNGYCQQQAVMDPVIAS